MTMPDITKCTNSRCVKRLDCYRFTSVPSLPVQAVDIFVPENNNADGFRCDMMMGHGTLSLYWVIYLLIWIEQRRE